jgi:ATP-dependent DNA helicase RecQ
MTPHEILKQYFGYDTFRGGQEILINHILTGRDALGVMPTGAGKSLCFQIPALITAGVTLVVSPLISLMKDQVNALTQSGVPAAFINSSLTERQTNKALENARAGMYTLIYIAPERLSAPSFVEFSRSAEIAMLTVDEAHCISREFDTCQNRPHKKSAENKEKIE